MPANRPAKQDPAFKNIPPPPCACAGFVGFRAYDGAAVSYTRRILFKGRYVLLAEGARVGDRAGFDFWTRPTPDGFFAPFTHGNTTTHEDARDLLRKARVYEAVNEADDQEPEGLHVYLLRLGGKYQRAALSEPRDFDTLQAIEKALEHLCSKHEDRDCGLMFRRGQNVVRRARGLETGAAW